MPLWLLEQFTLSGVRPEVCDYGRLSGGSTTGSSLDVGCDVTVSAPSRGSCGHRIVSACGEVGISGKGWFTTVWQ